MEKGFTATDAIQPETALGTEWVHGVDDHRFWHTDLDASRGNAAGRPSCVGTHLLHRDLLDGPDSCRCDLFFARRLAQGRYVRRRACSFDYAVFFPRSELRRVVRLARLVQGQWLTRAPTKLCDRAMTITALVFSLLVVLLSPILLVRFRKRSLARFHRAITNPIVVRFASRLPGFAVIKHKGRQSGRLYSTPVNIFREADGFLIALTYGRDSGWVKNVLAAGSCQLETHSVQYQLRAPNIVHDPTRRRFPFLVRVVLRLIDANDFMQLSNSHRSADSESRVRL